MSDEAKLPELPEGVSDFVFYQRFDNYLQQFGGRDPKRRGEAYDLAHGAAMAEMMDEIHLMLRILCRRPRDD